MTEMSRPTPMPRHLPPEVSASDAWRDVLTQLDALGSAVGRWIKAAVNDPDNRAHAEQIKTKMQEITSSVSDVVDKASESEVGQSFKEAAEKTGEALKKAGEKISEEVGPSLAGAFAALRTSSAKRRRNLKNKAADTGTAESEPGSTPGETPKPE